MSKYIAAPYSNPLKTKSVVPIDQMAYATDTSVCFMNSSSEESPDIFNIDLHNSNLESRANSETEGTYDKVYSKEGVFANPASIWPSSFFFPAPPVLKGLFSGPASLIKNYQLMIGIVAIVAVSSTGGSTSDVRYNTLYKTLPQQVINNQDLENQFFGD